MTSDLRPLATWLPVNNLGAGDSMRLNLKIIALAPFIFFSHTFDLYNFLGNKFNDFITIHLKNISSKIRHLLNVYALFLALQKNQTVIWGRYSSTYKKLLQFLRLYHLALLLCCDWLPNSSLSIFFFYVFLKISRAIRQQSNQSNSWVWEHGALGLPVHRFTSNSWTGLQKTELMKTSWTKPKVSLRKKVLES